MTTDLELGTLLDLEVEQPPWELLLGVELDCRPGPGGDPSWVLMARPPGACAKCEASEEVTVSPAMARALLACSRFTDLRRAVSTPWLAGQRNPRAVLAPLAGRARSWASRELGLAVARLLGRAEDV